MVSPKNFKSEITDLICVSFAVLFATYSTCSGKSNVRSHVMLYSKANSSKFPGLFVTKHRPLLNLRKEELGSMRVGEG